MFKSREAIKKNRISRKSSVAKIGSQKQANVKAKRRVTDGDKEAERKSDTSFLWQIGIPVFIATTVSAIILVAILVITSHNNYDK